MGKHNKRSEKEFLLIFKKNPEIAKIMRGGVYVVMCGGQYAMFTMKSFDLPVILFFVRQQDAIQATPYADGVGPFRAERRTYKNHFIRDTEKYNFALVKSIDEKGVMCFSRMLMSTVMKASSMEDYFQMKVSLEREPRGFSA